MKKLRSLILFGLLVVSYVGIGYAKKINVTFLNPGVSNAKHGTGGFWLNVSNFMKASSEDLDIELTILYAERMHTRLPKLAKQACDQQPDYIVMVNEMKQAGAMLKNCQSVPTFFILNSLLPEQIQTFGLPREKNKNQNWYGSLIPDNYFAGYTIAQYVFRDAFLHKKFASNNKIQVFGIAGDHVTPAAIERNNGLKQAVKDYKIIDLKQIVVGKWNKNISRTFPKSMLSRYPEIGAIWAANDPMALGVIEGLVEQHKIPGKDIFVGGLNWDPPALNEIKKGRMVASLGGHFMTGGWAMIILYDHANGIDFGSKNREYVLKHKIFDVIHQGNVNQYTSKLGDQDWSKIDFRKFSKKLNPELKEYDFSLSAILQQL